MLKELESKKVLIDKLVDIYTDELIRELQLRDVIIFNKALAAVCSRLADEDFQLLVDAQNAAEGAAWQRFRELYHASEDEEVTLNDLFQERRYRLGY